MQNYLKKRGMLLGENDVEDMWATFLGSYSTRGIALLVFIAIPLGNLLCELGNLLAIRLGLHPHYFNKYFLVIGILGMLCFGFALFG